MREVLGDGNEQRRSLNLFHLRDGARFVSFERPNNLKGLR
jgi:hypothetical protein